MLLSLAVPHGKTTSRTAREALPSAWSCSSTASPPSLPTLCSLRSSFQKKSREIRFVFRMFIRNHYLHHQYRSTTILYYIAILSKVKLICPHSSLMAPLFALGDKECVDHYRKGVKMKVLTITTERVSLSKDTQRKCAPAFPLTRNKHFQNKNKILEASL